jgi:LmbE family N-acetylglucosaminyl deacetylase
VRTEQLDDHDKEESRHFEEEMTLPPHAAVRRRPHYRRDGAAVYFLISHRPALTLADDEIALYDALAEAVTVAELMALHPTANEHLAAWYGAEIIDILPSPPPAARPLVAIEPHMDDVALSAGGRLLLRRGERPVFLLSVTRESNVSGYWTLQREFFNDAAITALREAESSLVAELTGGTHRTLGIPDAPLRYRPASEWNAGALLALQDGLAAYLAFPPQSDDVRALAQRLADAVLPLDPAEVWIPLGLGGHVDHRMTRDACIVMIAEHWDRFANIPVLLYEDHPYSTYFPAQLDQIVRAFAARGTRLTPMPADITTVFDEKVRLVGVYASQFKSRAMEPKLRERSREIGDGAALIERAHRLENRPQLPPESELAPDAATIRAPRAAFQALSRDLRSLTIIFGAAVGPWERSMRILLELFPEARLRVLIANGRLWETSDWSDARVEVIGVEGWLGPLWREARRTGEPVIVIQFAPWPLDDRWRQQIFKTPLPAKSRLLHAGLAALFALRPRIVCRHLGDLL